METRFAVAIVFNTIEADWKRLYLLLEALDKIAFRYDLSREVLTDELGTRIRMWNDADAVIS